METMMSATEIGKKSEVLTIALGTGIFALPADIVLEILDPGPVTPIPTAHPYIGHLINFRGRVVPLADLRLRCGMPVAQATVDSRFVVLEISFDGDLILVAILVDKVYGVHNLDEVVLGQVPRFGMRWNPEFVKAVGKMDEGFVMVLDMDRIFAATDPSRSNRNDWFGETHENFDQA